MLRRVGLAMAVAGLGLAGCAACSGAPKRTDGPPQATDAGAGEAKMNELARKAEQAVAAGDDAVAGFVDETLAKDAAGLRTYLQDGASLRALLAVGAALRARGLLSLLDAGHQLLVEEHVWLVAGRAQRPPDGSRPSLIELHGQRSIPAEVTAAATRIAVTTARPSPQEETAATDEHKDPYRHLLLFHLSKASDDPSLDEPVARLLAAGLLGEISEVRLALLYDRRLVPLVAAALRIPGCDPAVRRVALQLRKVPPLPDDDSLAIALDAWWGAEGPYLHLNTAAFDRSGGEGAPGGWITADEWSMFNGEEWAGNSPEPPLEWRGLDADRRGTLARESLRRRKRDWAAWKTWMTDQRTALGL